MDKKNQAYQVPMIANRINEDSLESSVELIRALSHSLRLSILNYIDKHPGTNVSSIYNNLNLEQSITSQHLRVLRSSGLVNTVRDGKQILYSVNHDKIALIDSSIKDFLN